MPIHAHLSKSNYYLIVLLGHKLMRLPFMSTIELVDPELRDALALGPQLPLTAETLMRRRAGALELIDTVPKPNLPDIATDEIHVESAFGAKPIRVLTYRPITSDEPLPVIVHIHGGGRRSSVGSLRPGFPGVWKMANQTRCIGLEHRRIKIS